VERTAKREGGLGGAAAVGSVEVEGFNIVTGGDGLVGVLRGERLWICIGVETG